MRYPKPWQIGNIILDKAPFDLPFEPRLSTVEILDADNKQICSIRTYSEYIVKDIVDTMNEYDKSMRIKHCADCLYYIKDILSGDYRCKYPKDCVNKNLFERNDNCEIKNNIRSK